MKVYEANNIRNLALIGHAGSGKTTLAECMLFQSGAITRRGAVEDQNTASDYHDIEHERNCSIFSTPLIAEYLDTKINIIDTPGYDDYIGETIASIHVAETGMIVINGTSGFEVGSENGWNYSAKLNKPVVFVINKIDSDQSKFTDVVDDLKSQFGNGVAIIQYPFNPGPGFNSVIDLLTMKCMKFGDDGKVEIIDIPDSENSTAEALRNQLVESVAESDEDLMNLYFEEGDLSPDQLKKGLQLAIRKREIFPVFATSSKNFVGIKPLMDFIVEDLPAPNQMPMQVAEGSVKVACDPKSQLSLFVFKLFSDSRLGDLTYFKIKSGKINSGMDLVNETSGSSERFGAIYTMNGKKRDEVTELLAGDIGATVKLKSAHINDTLHEKNFNAKFALIEYPNPKIRTSIVPKTKGEEEKVGMGLHALHFEDPTIVVEHSQELRQTIVYAQGELHLAIAKWRLLTRYRVETELAEPRVPYRETIQKKAQGDYRHKKQSGGAGQFAEVHMMIEPWEENMPNPSGLSVRGKELFDLDWGGKLEYLNCIVGGVIDQRFMPAILKGVMDKMQEGPLTGSYVRDIRVIIFDGKMHPVDSNEAAFKTAGMMVFKNIFIQASPKLLEPVYEVDIKVPEDFVGDVMSDLPTRRGVILGIDTEGRYQKIKARMPLSELDKYSQGLRAMTQARATFNSRFLEYQTVPANVTQELVEAYKKSQHDDE